MGVPLEAPGGVSPVGRCEGRAGLESHRRGQLADEDSSQG